LDLSVAIGQALGLRRRDAGLTQAVVAERLGRPKSWIAKLERGQRSLLFSEAIALAELYDVELGSLWPRSRSR
jgi:transcriptional regulator with XRE-family HTH domain